MVRTCSRARKARLEARSTGGAIVGGGGNFASDGRKRVVRRSRERAGGRAAHLACAARRDRPTSPCSPSTSPSSCGSRWRGRSASTSRLASRDRLRKPELQSPTRRRKQPPRDSSRLPRFPLRPGVAPPVASTRLAASSTRARSRERGRTRASAASVDRRPRRTILPTPRRCARRGNGKNPHARRDESRGTRVQRTVGERGSVSTSCL